MSVYSIQAKIPDCAETMNAESCCHLQLRSVKSISNGVSWKLVGVERARANNPFLVMHICFELSRAAFRSWVFQKITNRKKNNPPSKIFFSVRKWTSIKIFWTVWSVQDYCASLCSYVGKPAELGGISPPRIFFDFDSPPSRGTILSKIFPPQKNFFSQLSKDIPPQKKYFCKNSGILVKSCKGYPPL